MQEVAGAPRRPIHFIFTGADTLGKSLEKTIGHLPNVYR